jgi:hypothetical protein
MRTVSTRTRTHHEPVGSSCRITKANWEAWKAQEASANELMDKLDRLLPHYDDELLCWLIAFLHSVATTRPKDGRDPWSVLLHSMQADRGPIVGLEWAVIRNSRGIVQREASGRYQITLDNALDRHARRWVLSHELAHVELGTLWLDSTPVEEVEAGELRTDEHAVERFDLPICGCARCETPGRTMAAP